MLWSIPIFTHLLYQRSLAIYQLSKSHMSLTDGNSGTRKINRRRLLPVDPSVWECKESGELMVARYRMMPESVAAVLEGDLLRTGTVPRMADDLLITEIETVRAATIDIHLETYLLATKLIPLPRNNHAYLQHPILHLILIQDALRHKNTSFLLALRRRDLSPTAIATIKDRSHIEKMAVGLHHGHACPHKQIQTVVPHQTELVQEIHSFPITRALNPMRGRHGIVNRGSTDEKIATGHDFQREEGLHQITMSQSDMTIALLAMLKEGEDHESTMSLSDTKTALHHGEDPGTTMSPSDMMTDLPCEKDRGNMMSRRCVMTTGLTVAGGR